MSKLLYVSASLFGAGSKSRLIAGEFVEAWRRSNPGTTFVERHLDPASIPHLTQATLAALMTPAEQRDAAQSEAVAFADTLIEEIEAADTVVLAVPMYNFTVPSTLKAWIDHITRAGRTFRYTASGPEGLLKGKKVFIVTGRGGVYTGDSPARGFDFQEPYLRGMLGFLGLDDVSFIHVEGLAISPESATQGLERARRAIGEILPAAVAA
jgi:FMN-dependent NADH-azoreductase